MQFLHEIVGEVPDADDVLTDCENVGSIRCRNYRGTTSMWDVQGTKEGSYYVVGLQDSKHTHTHTYPHQH